MSDRGQKSIATEGVAARSPGEVDALKAMCLATETRKDGETNVVRVGGRSPPLRTVDPAHTDVVLVGDALPVVVEAGVTMGSAAHWRNNHVA